MVKYNERSKINKGIMKGEILADQPICEIWQNLLWQIRNKFGGNLFSGRPNNEFILVN